MRKKQNNTTGHYQRHFRKFHDKKTTAHPQYVYDEDGREYKVIGITSSPNTKGIPNVLLERNPDPSTTDPAYMRTAPDTVKKGVRNERLKGWRLTDSDKAKAQKIIDNSKKKKPRK